MDNTDTIFPPFASSVTTWHLYIGRECPCHSYFIAVSSLYSVFGIVCILALWGEQLLPPPLFGSGVLLVKMLGTNSPLRMGGGQQGRATGPAHCLTAKAKGYRSSSELPCSRIGHLHLMPETPSQQMKKPMTMGVKWLHNQSSFPSLPPSIFCSNLIFLTALKSTQWRQT